MTDAVKIAERYIDLWNETNPQNRKKLIASAWTEDAIYVDPMMKGQGHAEISALIGAVHERFPGHRFQLSGAPDGHGDRLRFSWTLGAPDARAGRPWHRFRHRRRGRPPEEHQRVSRSGQNVKTPRLR